MAVTALLTVPTCLSNNCPINKHRESNERLSGGAENQYIGFAAAVPIDPVVPAVWGDTSYEWDGKNYE